MVEHIRHALARSGFPVRPREIRTLANCLEGWSPQAAAPAALLDLLIEQALDQLRPERFTAVAGFPGFRRALAELFENVPPQALPADLMTVEEEVERNLKARGLGLRHERLRAAAPAVLPANVILDGFFTLSAAETELILAMAGRADVTITLPDWPGSQAVRKTLLSAGFTEQQAFFRSPLREAPCKTGRILGCHHRTRSGGNRPAHSDLRRARPGVPRDGHRAALTRSLRGRGGDDARALRNSRPGSTFTIPLDRIRPRCFSQASCGRCSPDGITRRCWLRFACRFPD